MNRLACVGCIDLAGKTGSSYDPPKRTPTVASSYGRASVKEKIEEVSTDSATGSTS